ncbi:DUF3231 family protein [Priestia megaterium]|nr:DUF3231 family protein [Priestia megaterium]MED4218035.1 DUF3231 family protein [Priestia megaterium]WEZ41373.1 DUF3231 family protein [Priestia megaterium DSM 319]
MTSSEITSLWAQYIQDTISFCISKYVLAKVKDSEVYSLFEFTLELAEKHLHVLRDILKLKN